jgi:hypothetical protein
MIIWKRMRNPRFHNIIQIVFLIFILTGVLSEKQSFGQTRESLIKAGYIEKFTHFVQWPETNNSDSRNTFTIALIGKNTFGSDLEDLFMRTKVKNKTVKINYISSTDEIDNCMILFISGSEKNNLDNILKYTTGKPVLTISDTKGFGEKGVILNMFLVGNYVRYEINRQTLDKSGLLINSLLLNYAVIIGSND